MRVRSLAPVSVTFPLRCEEVRFPGSLPLCSVIQGSSSSFKLPIRCLITVRKQQHQGGFVVEASPIFLFSKKGKKCLFCLTAFRMSLHAVSVPPLPPTLQLILAPPPHKVPPNPHMSSRSPCPRFPSHLLMSLPVYISGPSLSGGL